MSSVLDGDTASFAVGDHVVALYAIGLIRRRVARGTVGVVAGFSTAYDVEVRFSNGSVELVRPEFLAGCADA
jgi:hypothetical protein